MTLVDDKTQWQLMKSTEQANPNLLYCIQMLIDMPMIFLLKSIFLASKSYFLLVKILIKVLFLLVEIRITCFLTFKLKIKQCISGKSFKPTLSWGLLHSFQLWWRSCYSFLSKYASDIIHPKFSKRILCIYLGIGWDDLHNLYQSSSFRAEELRVIHCTLNPHVFRLASISWI